MPRIKSAPFADAPVALPPEATPHTNGALLNDRIIPVTPIWALYQEMRGMPQKARLDRARLLLDDPEGLADVFATSVEAFQEYSNIEEGFYPERPEPRANSDLQKTDDVVLRLADQGGLHVTEATARFSGQSNRDELATVPADRLACEYVDRELLVQRTSSPARWSDGRRNVGGLRLDVLLADAIDRTPIVAELKLPGDMDPFFALVQALACAAHLATPNQYERMRRHLPGANFPAVAQPPRLDVWLLYVDWTSELAPGKYMGALHQAAERLAPLLLRQSGVSSRIRRIAGVSLKLDGTGIVSGQRIWGWEKAE